MLKKSNQFNEFNKEIGRHLEIISFERPNWNLELELPHEALRFTQSQMRKLHS